MTTPLSAAVLLVQQTADEIFTAALELAATLGLPVESWRAGDPTRTQFRAQANKLAQAEQVRIDLAKASFITGPAGDRAEGEWLKLRAADVYGVDPDEATYATPTVTIENLGGGVYEFAALSVTFSSSVTGATYRNQAAFSIAALDPGVTISLVAEQAGSAGNAATNDIDTIVSPTIEGANILGSTAATGVDEQSEQGIVDECLATLGALSPDGPVDAYEFVARNEELTGITGVTRALADGDSADGTITVYVATTTAVLDAPSVAAIQAAVDVWAQPLCSDAAVVSGTAQTVAVTLTGIPSEAQAVVEAALDTLFAATDFGATIYLDAITSAARVASVAGGYVVPGAITCTLPAVDTTLATGVFPVRGTVTLA